MVNNTFRKFSGQSATISLNGRDLMCVHDYKKVSVPATYIVRDGIIYGYKSGFVLDGLFYSIYEITDFTFSKLVLFVEKSTCPTLIEFCYD